MKESDFSYILKKLKVNRGYKKFGSDLTRTVLLKLWNAQGGQCPFTGVSLILPNRNKQIPLLYKASLDRIENTKGYTADNVRFVSLMYNYAKHQDSDQSVLEFCRRVVKHHEDNSE